MSPLRDKLSEFQKSVDNAASNGLFGNEFCKLSFKGNRRGMIEMLMKLPGIKNFEIENYFNGKDEDVAKNLYKEILTLNDPSEKNQLLLTTAFFTASYKSSTFLNILMELTRNWYKLGKFTKCCQYCKYFENLENFQCRSDIVEEFRIEFLLIKSECYKRLGLVENSKLCLNDAMKKVNEFIENKFGREYQDFKAEKVCFLNPIFERLNLMRIMVEENSKFENNLIEQEKKIPKVEGKSNEKLKSCSDAISLGFSETKGRFLFATRRIKTGSVLIVDQPFVFSTDEEALERNCLNCHISLKLEDTIRIPCNNCQTVSFCSEVCHQESWQKYHKFECGIFNYFFNLSQSKQSHFLLAYRITTSKALTTSGGINFEFLKYHSLDKAKSPEIGPEIYDPLNYKTVFLLETHCAQTDPKTNFQIALRSIFLAKLLEFVLREINPEISIDQEQMILLAVGNFHHLQAIGCNAYEIVENVRDETSKVFEPRNIGGAIYTSVSLTNHSCYPNVIRHSFPGGTVVVTTLRPIEKGTEILDCYGPHFLKDKRNFRRDQLMKKYYFVCDCEACTLDWKLPLPEKTEFRCCCSNANLPDLQKCLKCDKVNWKKFSRRFEESKKKKLNAISKMYDGNYTEALPILLDHSNCVESILSQPNLESIKTQQSIIQCLNSMACISIE